MAMEQRLDYPKLAPAAAKTMSDLDRTILERSSICGLAVGYTDPDFPTNKLRIGRDPVAKHVVFFDH
jgi:hypothetical protein